MLHRHLALLEASDAAELTALLRNPRVAALVTARISERAVVTTRQAAQELDLVLKRAGVSVTVTDEFTH
jgi:hypothetical protein